MLDYRVLTARMSLPHYSNGSLDLVINMESLVLSIRSTEQVCMWSVVKRNIPFRLIITIIYQLHFRIS